MSESALSGTEILDTHLAPILEHLDDEHVTEIQINRWDQIFVETTNRGVYRVPSKFDSESALIQLISMIARATDQQLDPLTKPILDGHLEHYHARVNAVLPPWAAQGATLCLRLFPKSPLTIDSLLEQGSLTASMFSYLRRCVEEGANLIVAGGTGSGKTTLLNVLNQCVPADERVVTVEDSRELRLSNDNWVSFVTGQRTGEGASIGLADFVRVALRQNPDRIIVGEIRDQDAAFAFLQAINTGHRGCMATIHANSPADTLVRLQYFLGLHGLPFEFADAQVRANLNVIVQAIKTPQGRRVSSICELDKGKINNVF